jgi:hypothetical protein
VNNTVALSVNQCRSTVRDDLAASKAVLKDEVNASLAACVTWGVSCKTSCDAG